MLNSFTGIYYTPENTAPFLIHYTLRQKCGVGFCNIEYVLSICPSLYSSLTVTTITITCWLSGRIAASMSIHCRKSVVFVFILNLRGIEETCTVGGDRKTAHKLTFSMQAAKKLGSG